jgi:hypothetical protein
MPRKELAMAHLTTVEELLAAWSEVTLTPDPRSALTAAGHTIDPSLSARLAQAAQNPHRLTPPQRTELLERLRAQGGPLTTKRVHLAIRPRQPVIAHALPPDQFDMVASVRLEKVDEVLAGLFATRVWQQGLSPAEVGPLVSLDDLRGLSDDVPELEGLAVGALHLTAAPKVEVGPSGALRLAQPLRIDVDLIRETAPRRTTVTSLSGIFQYDAQPRAEETAPGVISVALDASLGLDTEEFQVSDDSLIQPRTAEALTVFASGFVPLAAAVIREELSDRSLVICPDLHPFDIPVRVFAAEARTAATSSGSGALNVGILVGFGDDAVAPRIPDLDVLEADPFGDSAFTVKVTVHEATLQAAADASVDAVEREMNDRVPLVKVVVDSATVQLRPPDTLRLKISAHIPDFCGPGPFNFVDLDFDVILDAEVSVPPETIRFEGDPEVDLDNTDAALCVIASLTDIVSLHIVEAHYKLGEMIVGRIWIETKLAETSLDFNGMYDDGTPVTGTELLPRGEVQQIGMTEDRMELRGALTLRPDTKHIFAYVRVREALSRFLVGGPVANARVQIIDQDAPAPPGDDFEIPTLVTPVIVHGATATRRRDLSFKPPERDEVIGTATTDDDGLARLILDRSTAGGSGGTLVTEQTITFTQQEKEDVVTITEAPLAEELPDAYLRVTLPDGRKFDSRQMSGIGLMINLDADHIGSAAAPILVTVPRAEPVKPK